MKTLPSERYGKQPDNTFGEILRRYRTMAGITQAELARQSNISRSILSRFEANNRRPRMETLQRMVHALGLSRGESEALLATAGYVSFRDIDAFGEVPTEPNTVVVDPVQGHIRLTSLERQIVDTKSFQRLRRIQRLGMTSLVYPSAVHTRFEHSLGTVEVAQRMIDAVNRNPSSEGYIDDEAATCVRLVALLHDIDSVSFDPPQCGNNTRTSATYFLGRDSEIGSILPEDLWTRVRLCILNHSNASYDGVVDSVGSCMDFGSIVYGDLGAAQLDALRRDSYFCGLSPISEFPRFMRYLSFTKKGDPRADVAVDLVKGANVRRDVLNEIFDMLRSCYLMNERVYFDPTAVVVSAMVSKAVRDADVSKGDLIWSGDGELLAKIERSSTPGRKIAELLLKRRLYKPVYIASSWNAHSLSEDDSEITTRNPAAEGNFVERLIEESCGMPDGTVIVHQSIPSSPNRGAKVLVRWFDGRVMPLIKIPLEPVDLEFSHFHQLYRSLQKLYVFVHPDHVGIDDKAIEKAIIDIVGFPNEIAKPQSLEIPTTPGQSEAHRSDASNLHFDQFRN